MIRVSGRAALLFLLASVATACGQDVPTVTVPPPPTATPTAIADDAALRLDFEALAARDSPPTNGLEVQGPTAGVLGGVLRTAGETPVALQIVEGQEPGSTALQFPAPCDVADESCGKAIIEVLGTADFDVAATNFQFGATLRMSPQQMSKGSNVMQRGFSVGGGGQWKLQVDGEAGRPSCVLVGSGDDTIHEATSALGVADGDWHEVVCQREGDVLSILVDGTVEGETDLPPGLSAEPEGPLRIAGKNLKPNNDQFFGALDEVVVRLTPAP